MNYAYNKLKSYRNNYEIRKTLKQMDLRSRLHLVARHCWPNSEAQGFAFQ